MQKIPVPAVIALLVAAVLLLGFVIFKNTDSSSGSKGNVEAITAEIMKNNPKDAPQLPPDTSHVDMGARKKHGG